MSDPTRPGILVVDDDRLVRSSLAMLFEASGYEVSTAINGFDALLQLKRRLPAIVLSDLNMPQMSGFELLSVVRQRFPQISVIAMSGAYHSGEAVPGGVIADAFYAKGHGTPAMLLRIVADLIQTSAAHAVATHDFGGKQERGPMLDPARHQILIVDDNASVRDTLALFLQVSGYEVTTAANGEEALALLKVGAPAVLLSELYMPAMSGFELLTTVRQKFPELPLIAMSGAYETRDAIPGGVTADAFYAKGHGNLRFLLNVLSAMTRIPAAQADESPTQSGPRIH